MNCLKSGGKRNRKETGPFRSFFPSREQRNDPELKNRMKLCVLSIFLMWASSLGTTMYIASYSIDVPSILSLYHSCKSAFQVILDEKERFGSCVDVQIEQCKSSLHKAIKLELDRVNLASNQNTKFVKEIADASNNCSDTYTKLKNVLESWTALDQVVTFNNSSCSAKDQAMLLSSLVSIQTFKNEALRVSAYFEENSRNTFNQIVDFTKKRAAYDKEYLLNHSNTVQAFFDTEIVLEPFDISYVVNNITDNLEILSSCMSLKNSSNCKIQHYLNTAFINVKALAEKFKSDSYETYMEKIKVYEKYYNEMFGVLKDFESDLKTKVETWKKYYGGK